MTDEEDKRLVIDNAAEIVMVYALSDAFNWERDQDILVEILTAATKLKAILDARDLPTPAVHAPNAQD